MDHTFTAEERLEINYKILANVKDYLGPKTRNIGRYSVGNLYEPTSQYYATARTRDNLFEYKFTIDGKSLAICDVSYEKIDYDLDFDR